MKYAEDEQSFFNEHYDTFNNSALALFDKYKIEQDNKLKAFDIGMTLLDAFRTYRGSSLLELYVYADTDD